MRTIILLLSLLLATPCFAGVLFFGESDYLKQADGLGTDVYGANQDITICAWIKRINATSIDETFVAKYSYGDDRRQYNLQYDSTAGKIDFNICGIDGTSGNLTIASGGTTINTNTWYHVCGVYDDDAVGDDMFVYVNGSLDGSDDHDSKGIYASTIDFTIGTLHESGTPVGFWDGEVTEVAIWHTALSAEQVANLGKSRIKGMPLQIEPDSLRFYAPLDDYPAGQGTLNNLSFDNAASTAVVEVVTGVDVNDGSDTVGEKVLSYAEPITGQ